MPCDFPFDFSFFNTVCEFEMGGPEGIIESKQIVQEGKASPTEAVDCKWFIRAPPKSKVSVVPGVSIFTSIR